MFDENSKSMFPIAHDKAMMLYPKLNPKSAYGPTLYQGPTNSQPGHPGQIEKITG